MDSDVDAINTFGVSAGHLPSFHVVKFHVSAGHDHFCAGFDSRQRHREYAGQGFEFTRSGCCVKPT
jgi:hypothetical protein